MIGGEALPPIILNKLQRHRNLQGRSVRIARLALEINVRATHRVAPNGARLL